MEYNQSLLKDFKPKISFYRLIPTVAFLTQWKSNKRNVFVRITLNTGLQPISKYARETSEFVISIQNGAGSPVSGVNQISISAEREE